MCGITGVLKLRGDAPDPGQVSRMMNRMSRRGPDDCGLILRGPVALGHRRLKIIDPGEASQQPMADAELGLSVVFNGAIYNYRELRGELESKGYRFFSRGDTEVILKAYHAWGTECVRRFNGMFAFVIHERESGRLVIARDRLGIKPFYHTRDRDSFRFASTLPALLAAGGVDCAIDPVALNFYMSFHSVVPPERTLLRGVKKLPPATIAIVEPDGTMRQERYWDLCYGPREEEKRFRQREWEDATLEALRRAVKRRLVADVPVGVLLSGGLDSSLIVGLLAEQGTSPIDTFSIGFETVGNEAGDEFRYSDRIAEHYQTRHHKLAIDSRRTLPALHACVAAMSEPMVSHDNVGFYLLSQEVAKTVRVVQSGQGADEIFGGYHWYPPLITSRHPVDDYAGVFFDRDYAEYCRTVSEPWHQGDFARRFVEAHFARPGADSAVDKALRLDTQVMLTDDPVKRVDNHTMAASLEARVPFLDHEVVELAARIPADLKIREGGKFVLKEAARRVIPAEVIDRPKGYFPVPALKYLRGEFLALAQEALCNDTARGRGLFRHDYVEELLRAPEKHLTPLRGSKLWQLALLELWLQTHDIS